jgi:hypothetical protein
MTKRSSGATTPAPANRLGERLRKPGSVTATAFMSVSAVGAGVAAISATSALPAAATTYHVRVTCDVPNSQKERQLARNSCLNYLHDGTQTYTAHVENGRGNPVGGVWVRWHDSDRKDAHFRLPQTPCRTGPRGMCSAELVDTDPEAGEKITIRATVAGFWGRGYLTFRAR